jgi:hypothetical protein
MFSKRGWIPPHPDGNRVDMLALAHYMATSLDVLVVAVGDVLVPYRGGKETQRRFVNLAMTRVMVFIFSSSGGGGHPRDTTPNWGRS